MASGGISASMKIEGLDNLRRALRELPEKVQARQLANATAAGGRVILKKARALVPVDTGLLQRMLRVTRGKRKDSYATAYVTVRRLVMSKVKAFIKGTGKKSSANRQDPYYWQVLEFGKTARTKHPFIRPAFDAEKENAAAAMKKALAEGIEKEARKLSWGNKR